MKKSLILLYLAIILLTLVQIRNNLTRNQYVPDKQKEVKNPEFSFEPKKDSITISNFGYVNEGEYAGFKVYTKVTHNSD